jgi:hypothetical protein
MTQCPYQALASCDRVVALLSVALSILSNGFAARPFVLTHEGATPPDGCCYANICGVLCSRAKKRMFRGFDVATPAAGGLTIQSRAWAVLLALARSDVIALESLH